MSERASRIRRGVHALAFAIGLLGFALLVHTVGWAGIVDTLRNVGRWFAVIAAIDAASVLCDAGGLYNFVRPHAPIHYGRVFAAQASGLAINRLTPGNSLGEPIKVTMLMEHVPEAAAVSAVVMFNVATILVAIAVLVIGVPITLLLVDLPPQIQVAVAIAVGVLVVVAGLLLRLVRRGALGTVVDTLRRLRVLSPARAARLRDRLASIDANLRQFGDAPSRRGLAFVAASRVLNWAGTIVLLHAAAVPMTATLVIGLLSVGQLVLWMSNVIPLGLGLYDGGSYALYSALGANADEGLGFAMTNRVRTILLALIGLAVMLVASLVRRIEQRPSG